MSRIIVPGSFPPPRISYAPESCGTLGPAIVEAARSVDIPLDGHQEYVLNTASGIRPRYTTNHWAATQVGWSEPRQNGKSNTLLARTVGGILVLGEKQIIHSAHEVKTAMGSYQALKDLCLNYDVLSRRVKKIVSGNGREAILFKGGPDVSYMARTTGSGRGFSASTVLLDEAQQLSFAIFAAILPTLSAVRNSQVWMTGTPPDTKVMNGEVFTRLRLQALGKTHPRLAFIEWSGGPEKGQEKTFDASDPENWMRANPACPDRISLETIEDEFNAMDEDTFRRDRLGEWDDDGADTVIPLVPWEQAADEGLTLVHDLVVAIDTSPNRSTTSVVLAGLTADRKKRGIRLVARGGGTDWVMPLVRKIVHENEGVRAVVIDSASPASSMIEILQQRFQVRVTSLQTRHMAMACGQAYDGFVNGDYLHDGSTEMTAAMLGSAKRDLQDSWGLSRKRAEVDISAFVAGVLALYGVALKKVERPKIGERGRRKVSVA